MKTENKPILITSIIAGVILVVALAFLFTFQPDKTNSADSITVQGVSTIKATPDLISIYFNIETKGKTSAEATSANTEILTNFTNALKEEGFNESEIKTQNFNVYENTYWEDNKMKNDGFIATHSVIIELTNNEFDKISEVIDAGVGAGAGVSYINFELSQKAQNEYKAQALELAAQDAKVKAEAVAKGFGKSLGKLVSAQVTNFGYYPMNLYSASSGEAIMDSAVGAKEAVANMQPSDQEVTGSISATYKMR